LSSECEANRPTNRVPTKYYIETPQRILRTTDNQSDAIQRVNFQKPFRHLLYNAMILHAQINPYGTLNATLPKLFWGKRVVIVLSEEYDSEPFKTTSQLQNESQPEHDETAYLLSSPANEKRLEQARKEFERGQWTEVDDLDELFINKIKDNALGQG
jgi:PHD/YefM family antitoxin component YafN of YafNO toxin-antitoxin module